MDVGSTFNLVMPACHLRVNETRMCEHVFMKLDYRLCWGLDLGYISSCVYCCKIRSPNAHKWEGGNSSVWKEIQVPLGKDLQGPAFNLWSEDKCRVVVEIKSMERRPVTFALGFWNRQSLCSLEYRSSTEAEHLRRNTWLLPLSSWALDLTWAGPVDSLP